jgi:hypothetical protein
MPKQQQNKNNIETSTNVGGSAAKDITTITSNIADENNIVMHSKEKPQKK